MRPLSIRTRLLAGTALGVAVTFAVASAVVYVITRSQLYAQFDENLAARAHTLTALIEQDGSEIETELAREDLATEYHQLWTADGKVLRRSRSLGNHELERRDRSSAIPPTTIAIEPVVLPDGRPGRQATLALDPHQDEAPRATPIRVQFAIARDVESVEGTLATLRRTLGFVAIGAILLAVVVLAAAVRFGLRPVRELALAIGRLRSVEHRLDDAGTPPELRPVVVRVDELLGRLEVAFERERGLTADVAHELRTPLAGLRATIEQVRSRERTPERYVTALDDCLAIVVQTEHVMAALLTLARADAGQVKLAREPVELGDLVRDILRVHAARADQRGLTVEQHGDATWETDREQLRLVLHNLIDNAVEHSDQGGAIRIELAADTLVVSNTGCRLEPAQLARVFERFWRADAARSEGHAGLGLALTRRLVELLGGAIRVERSGDRFVATIQQSGTSKPAVDRSRSDV